MIFISKKKKITKSSDIAAIDSMSMILQQREKQRKICTRLYAQYDEYKKDGKFKNKKTQEKFEKQLKKELQELRLLENRGELYLRKYGPPPESVFVVSNKKKKNKQARKAVDKNSLGKSKNLKEESVKYANRNNKTLDKGTAIDVDTKVNTKIDEEIIAYILDTGMYELYEYLSKIERRELLLKIWQLDKPILKGVFNGSLINEVRHPKTNEILKSPIETRKLQISNVFNEVQNEREVFFVFGVVSHTDNQLIFVSYYSENINDCIAFLEKNPVKVVEEDEGVFRNRKLKLCKTIAEKNNYLRLEEFNAKSKEILKYEVQFLGKNNAREFYDSEKKAIVLKNKTIIERECKFGCLGNAKRSLIKLMLYLSGDIRLEAFSLLPEYLRSIFLQYYWNYDFLILPCKIIGDNKLESVFGWHDMNHMGQYPNPFYQIYPGKTVKKIQNFEMDIDENCKLDVEDNYGEKIWAVVAVKDNLSKEKFLYARYVSKSETQCRNEYASVVKTVMKKFSIEQQISLINLLVAVYKIDERQYIKKEIQSLLNKLEKIFDVTEQSIDVNKLLQRAERKKQDVTSEAFLVRCNIWYCVHGHHSLQDILAGVNVILEDGTIVKKYIPAAYCATCNMYYILDADYKKLKGEGVILCKVIKRELLIQKNDISDTYLEWNEESILHSLGYNVNAQSNLTDLQRRRILEYVVDNKILSRTAICNHLDWLINRSTGNRNMNLANRKWNDDRNYISQYQRNNERIVDADSLVVNEYRIKR